MIVFQAGNYRADLSKYNISLNEESNMFKDNMIKSYSLPFTADLDDELFVKLGLPNIDNVTSFESVIRGYLIVDDRYFESELIVGEIIDQSVEIVIYYGEEVLSVYATDMKNLPWPIIITADLKASAKAMLTKTWPETSHNFPKVYRPEIKEESDYEAFEYFMNNYNGSTFVENIVGNKQTVIDTFNYDLKDDDDIVSEILIGVYEKEYVLENVGTYYLNYQFNFLESFTSYFRLRIIKQKGSQTTELYNIVLQNQDINLDDQLQIDVDYTNQSDTIIIILSIERTLTSITPFNELEFVFEDPNVVTFQNKNVMVPCPYLLEMIAHGYKSAGKKVRGNLFEHEKLKKAIYIPENYMEVFKGSTFDSFQFDRPTRNEEEGNIAYGIYEKIYTLNFLGSYNLKINLNLDPVFASYFSLKVIQVTIDPYNDIVLYEASSTNNRVNISEEIIINVDTLAQFDNLKIELKLKNYSGSISQYNSFEYSFQEGRLNTFPNSYSLANFMPDLTFGEFINAIKNWLNLEIKPIEDYVYINFVKDEIAAFNIVNHSHLEAIKPKKKRNTDRVFKLIYTNKKEVMVDYSGQIYSDVEKRNHDIIKIEMEVQDAIVEQNHGVVTGVYPEDPDGMLFALYNGLKSNQNICIDKINNSSLRVEDIYEEFWREWLMTRTNNFTFKDRFIAHESEILNMRTFIFKYNQRLLPILYNKKRTMSEYWDVEMQAESF